MKILLVLLLLLTSCKTLGIGEDEAAEAAKEEAPTETTNAADVYNQAQDLLEKSLYKKAAEKFLEVERDHPYSQWSTKAQVQAAYSYYKDEQYDKSVATLDRFIKLNPGNDNVPYSYYLIALSYYNQIANVERDQGITNNAKKALRDVIARFPDTSYARDAKWKLDLVEDHLAGKELAVGRYYLDKRQYIGAINRFKEVVENYSTTVQVEEALHRLVEAYLALGVIPEAQKYAAVLGHNYPGSEWYQDSYDLLLTGEMNVSSDDESWW